MQWVPGHHALLTDWATQLAPGGWLAVQVPGNSDQPSDQILRELTGSAPWQPLLAGVQLNSQAADPAAYPYLLATAGCTVDAWEATYLHVLRGPEPVLDWYKGTGLRPVLAALSPGAAAIPTLSHTTHAIAPSPTEEFGSDAHSSRGGQEAADLDPVRRLRVMAAATPAPTSPS